VRRFTPWVCMLALTVVLPATISAQDQSAPAKPAASGQTKAPAPKPGGSLLHPETLKAKAPDVYEVTFTTTKGDFVIQVTRAWAPLGADRFYNLVKNHFFDSASFFRVVPDFVVQFGLTGNPAVNKAWENAKIKDDPVTQSNKAGYITFATAGPNTRTTQVFINLVNNARLDGMGFAAFGQVTSGMDVVKQLYGGYGDAPPSGHGPDQGSISSQGKPYLDKNFPNLDSIKTAKITSPAPAPAAKKSSSGAAPAKP